MEPKFGIWAFSAIFALFLVAKNQINFDNIFNVYSYIVKMTKIHQNTGTFDFENFCNFQPYLMLIH